MMSNYMKDALKEENTLTPDEMDDYYQGLAEEIHNGEFDDFI